MSNPFASWLNSGSGVPPSIFGALPYPSTNSSATPSAPSGATIIYTFTHFSNSILNCAVLDQRSKQVFQVSMDTAPSFTVLKDADGRRLATIEWKTHPLVEIQGVLPRQEARSWLPLAPDARSRMMTIGSTRYAWAPSGNYVLLYASTHSTPLACIARTPIKVMLEITESAVDTGLLGPCLIATVLLLSGRNID